MNYRNCPTHLLISLTLVTFLVPCAVFAQSVPYAITLGATAITEKSLRANCRISANDTTDTQYWVEWAIANRGVFYETNKVTVFGQATVVGVDLYGLAPDLGYNYRCVAENSRGKDVGVTTYVQTKTLSNTQDPAIIMQTLDVVDVTETSALLRGYASPHGTNNAERWFEWGTTASLGNSTYRISQGWYSGKYEFVINGLQPGTTYYYRAAGKNSSGTSYGSIQIFSTKGKRLSETIGSSASMLIDDVRTLGTENIISTGGTVSMSWSTSEDYSYISIQYGDTPKMERAIEKILVVGKNQVSHPIIGLTPDTTYYYRAVLYRKDGEVKKFGETKTFVTKPANITSNSGAIGASSGSPITQGGLVGSKNSAVGASGTNGPQFVNPLTFFKKFYGLGGDDTTTTAGNTATSSAQNATTTKVETSERTPDSQVAAVGAGTGILGKFWSSVTKENSFLSQVSVDADKKAHETVEYRIRYANETNLTYRNAVLKVIYPKNVIYVGDDTSNEFMVEDSAGGPERTYVLNLGDIKPGNRRIITMLGVMTSDTTTDPTPRVRIEYIDGSGAVAVLKSDTVSPSVLAKLEAKDISQGKGMSSQGATSSSGSTLLPNSFIGWLVYVAFVVLSILGYIKGRAYYLKRKKEIEEEEKRTLASAQLV